MKKMLRSFVFSVLMLTSFSSVLFAQTWVEMSRKADANYFDIVREGEQYFSTRFKGKGSGYKQFQRWVAEYKLRADKNGHIVSVAENIQAINHYQRTAPQRRTTAAPNMSWTELGPNNEEQGPSGQCR